MKINISQLELKTIMGVYEWERQCPMLIHADITVDIDLNSINDNLDSTVNYFTLSQALIKRAAACDYQRFWGFHAGSHTRSP